MKNLKNLPDIESACDAETSVLEGKKGTNQNKLVAVLWLQN